MTVLVSLVSILAFFDLEKIVGLFGFIPAEAFRHGGLTFITPFCFHGGILHLVSNMYFLIILGDAAEEDLGWDKFLMVVIGSAILGCLTRLTFDYGSTIPGIGASGGVAALVTYYALKYPWHRFGVAIRVLFLPRLFIIPAVILAILWVLMQILLSYLQVIGFGSISGLDHLGGATGGMIAFLIWGRRPAKGQSPEKDPRPYGL